MGLRDHLRRLVDQQLRHARRTKRSNREKFLPRIETLELRAMLTGGTWQLLNTVNPASAPPQGTQTFMQLSDGTVMEAGFTDPGNAVGSTDWFTLKPDNAGSYITGSWGPSSRMNTSRLFFPTLMLPDGRVFAIGGEYGNPFGFVNSPEIYDPLTN